MSGNVRRNPRAERKVRSTVADLVGITLIKRFLYRGDATEEWSNKYHFTGPIPANNTAWKALVDALIAQEKTVYMSLSSVIRAYGYSDDSVSPNAVWSFDYLAAGATVAGTNTSPGNAMAGDQAFVVWWKTDRLNSKGRAVYLRKYFHSGVVNAVTPDSLAAGMAAPLDAFATKLRDGTFLDGRTIRARSHADTILSSGHDAFVTTRTLKRRGKRP